MYLKKKKTPPNQLKVLKKVVETVLRGGEIRRLAGCTQGEMAGVSEEGNRKVIQGMRASRRPTRHSLGSSRETDWQGGRLALIIFEFPINRVKRSFVARMNDYWFIT